ncbi:MAG: hypothetical protein IK114_13430, partial [Fibrobacter sp.]|nr:hypothetical protein [Fibrobacter sp.]
YQGVVRDADNKLVADKQVTVSVQILQGTDDGTAVYSENHEVTTNANGLMTFELGSKDAESFAKIDWSNAPYFVKTVAEFDGKQIQGVTPLLAVPYALYAAKAGNADVDLSNYALKSEIPAEVDLTDYAKKSEIPTDYVSSSALNTAIGEVEAKIPSATDLSGYYSKSDVDALLAELNAKIAKLDLQLNPPIPGAIEFAFSVSAEKQIYFSKGNLQYQASTGTWRFAEHQYDMIGNDNANISSTNSGWIDLFGWGTSGWNSGANAYQPYSTSTSYSDYYLGGDYTNNLTGSYANADWGVYNKISNGGNQAGQWRTLTQSEWDYLISGRAQASRLMGQGRVNNVNGLILLPDGWETPSSVKFTYDPGNYSTNVYSQDEWAVMQSYGAVFLPAAGYRRGTDVYYVGSYGYYWSSSAYDSVDAYYLGFDGGGVYADRSGRRDYGRSVRLVQEAE